ncbi:MAG: methyltransferase domain-containing protein [bacterium]|nr:methyltransferase domain-containing protein [bacterium]
MALRDTVQNWELLGRTDPLWAVLSRKQFKEGKWDVGEFFKSGEREVREVMEYIGRFPIPLAHQRALDFGCGVGRLTQALAHHFPEVYGVDCAPSMIRLAEHYNRHGQRCRYLLNTVDDLSMFPDHHFDFIYSAITLQHIEPYYAKRYIGELVRVLAAHGLFVFQLPTSQEQRTAVRNSITKRLLKYVVPSWALSRYRRARYGQAGFIETYGVPRADVVQLLESRGARILDVLETGRKRGRIDFRYCVTT